MTTCPAHGIALQQEGGRPRSRFYRIQHRIADRFGPDVAAAFMQAIESVRDQVDMAALEAAVRAGDFSRIEAALGTGVLSTTFQQHSGLRNALSGAFGATGQASADILSDALDVSFSFDARDPNAIAFARSQAATLVTRVTDDQRTVLRAIISRAQQEGIPPRRSARFIHKVVGLREDWAQAPLNLANEIRDGRAAAATSRRLDAATKARIRSRINAGTVTDDFIDEVTETYSHSLRRRRALDIARTETIRSSSAGLEESWSQAQRRNVLPGTARRFWIVTPDDRLRATHAAIPGMNPEGVKIGEPFETPFGSIEYPPAEPNCRCSVGLVPNPAEGGIL